MLCEIEEGMRGLYRSGEGFRVRPFRVGFGREIILNLKVGEVFGEESYGKV